MNLFGYFDLGRRAMDAFRLNMQVAGDNIANIQTPGYARRRAELTPGFPQRVPGGWLDQGVDVQRITRMEDRFIQASLDRERGGFGESEEKLRGLSDIEAAFGEVGGGGLADTLSQFASAFTELSGQPESQTVRLSAVNSASAYAGAIREAYGRLRNQRATEDQAVRAEVTTINSLANQLAALNVEIRGAEADGSVAAPLRDVRVQVIEQLSERTGGTPVDGKDGTLGFELPTGTTLVSGLAAIPLKIGQAADGTARIRAGGDGQDVTDRLRRGRLGGRLEVRDTAITKSMADLDTLAADMITRANALTASAVDLSGNPGGPLFVPNPPTGAGVAGKISVSAAILADPKLLAISASGAPGDGTVAADLAALSTDPSAAFGGMGAAAFIADGATRLGNAIAQADIGLGVSTQLISGLEAKRDAVSGVSLDEEAVELMRNQRAYEAAAHFLQVIDSMTQTTLDMFPR